MTHDEPALQHRCQCPELRTTCPACQAWAADERRRRTQAVSEQRRGRRRHLATLVQPPGTWHTVAALQHQSGYPRSTIQYLLHRMVAAGEMQRRGGRHSRQYALCSQEILP